MLSPIVIKRWRQVKLRSRWKLNELVDTLSPTPQKLQCPLCQYEGETSQFQVYQTRCLYRGGKLIRHQCPDCGVIFGTQRMLNLSAEELSQEYVKHYQCYNEGDSTESELETFTYLNPHKSGVYLNFGCGKWSKTITQLREQGYNIWGFEPYALEDGDPYLIRDWQKLKQMQFDGIMSNDVLEHLRYPDKILVEMAALLKPQGYMVHRTHCYEYSHEYTRFHLFFFTGKSLDLICEKVNLVYENTDRVDVKLFRKVSD